MCLVEQCAYSRSALNRGFTVLLLFHYFIVLSRGSINDFICINLVISNTREASVGDFSKTVERKIIKRKIDKCIIIIITIGEERKLTTEHKKHTKQRNGAQWILWTSSNKMINQLRRQWFDGTKIVPHNVHLGYDILNGMQVTHIQVEKART